MKKSIFLSIIYFSYFSVFSQKINSKSKVVRGSDNPKTTVHFKDNFSVRMDKSLYKKCNTARFSFYMGKQAKRTILLMNLSRVAPVFFADSILIKYDGTVKQKNRRYIESLYRDLKELEVMQVLKPSIGLWLSAFSHALISGITSYEGHRGLKLRLRLFLNLNGTYGENCDYGPRNALDIVMDLLIDEGIPGVGHRENILSEKFYRVGVSKKWHFQYRRNTVMDFSGKKFLDLF
ncbi:MAG: hypothetical protein A3H98_09220 [Bacteroidetes bacterium RIFCSPLOWO2_02_FULL_36_8]|nr:MAG: hypothetical protein A3H98_09220 [Bacteroidetes bacterium RIFCSPLOWO2_02_FULL_36_8]OFY69133.1 MAG: hypothetical protein A3G23_06190 [Bacteroidetes bacterium RIFCSPLOWO2_12_FULL_37_12]